MKKLSFYVLCILLAALCQAVRAATPPADAGLGGEGWVVMPAGGRPAYMGIHGGTMPVSLLVYGDGSSLITFVGRTGNDFLEVLRRTDLRMPSLLNATTAQPFHGGLPFAGNGTVLMAGSAASSMPVIYLTGEGLARMALAPDQLQPFGLSEKPLSIEGQVAKPAHLSPAKRYRLLFQPQYLQPRRGLN